jgi:hypothetical protein
MRLFNHQGQGERDVSEITRYRPTVYEVQAAAYCGSHPDGEYVSFADHNIEVARLKSALTAERTRREALEAALLHITHIGPLGVNTYPECYRLIQLTAEAALAAPTDKEVEP